MIFLALAVFTTSTYAFYPVDTIISGQSDELNHTVDVLSKYTPVLNEKTAEKDDEDATFIDKPEIIATKTRAEIDAEKIKEKQKLLAQSKRQVVVRERQQSVVEDISTPSVTVREGGNSYWYGFCTWYAANRRPDVPNNWGNAKTWLSSAQRDGRATGSNPQAGAIIVTGESWAGHVGYVESVDGDSVTISEMNYRGWARVNTRTMNINNGIIRGYIY